MSSLDEHVREGYVPGMMQRLHNSPLNWVLMGLLAVPLALAVPGCSKKSASKNYSVAVSEKYDRSTAEKAFFSLVESLKMRDRAGIGSMFEDCFQKIAEPDGEPYKIAINLMENRPFKMLENLANTEFEIVSARPPQDIVFKDPKNPGKILDSMEIVYRVKKTDIAIQNDLTEKTYFVKLNGRWTIVGEINLIWKVMAGEKAAVKVAVVDQTPPDYRDMHFSAVPKQQTVPAAYSPPENTFSNIVAALRKGNNRALEKNIFGGQVSFGFNDLRGNFYGVEKQGEFAERIDMCLSALNDAEIEIVGKRVPYVRDGKEILFYSADGFNRSNVCVGMPETPEQYIQLARIRYRINKSKIPMPIGAPGAFDATMMMTEKGWQLVEPFYFAWQLAVVPEPFNYNDELLKRSEVTWVETKTRMPARVMYRRDYDDLRKGIEAAMYSFELDTGNFPTTDAGFGALIAKPKNKIQGWRGPYIRELLSDQWGNPFFLKGDGTSYAVFSVGPDGIKDTMDDIPIASGRKNN